jgi:hypothetical protein
MPYLDELEPTEGEVCTRQTTNKLHQEFYCEGKINRQNQPLEFMLQ